LTSPLSLAQSKTRLTSCIAPRPYRIIVPRPAGGISRYQKQYKRVGR
jgi:hypothetical protein